MCDTGGFIDIGRREDIKTQGAMPNTKRTSGEKILERGRFFPKRTPKGGAGGGEPNDGRGS